MEFVIECAEPLPFSDRSARIIVDQDPGSDWLQSHHHHEDRESSGMILVWDEPKRTINIRRHGLDFSIVTLPFFLNAIVRPAKADRLQGIGYIDGMLVSLVFKPLGTEAISLISLRPAGAKEKALL